MLCRSALVRLGAQAPKRPSPDVAAIANRLHHLGLSGTPVRVSAYARTFATEDKPVGRPKKGGAVTAKASTRRAPKKAATEGSAASKPKKTTSGRPKKKATKKKAKAAPKKKKVLTEKQLARAKQQKLLDEIRELSAVALLRKEPKAQAATAWTVYNSENVPKGSGTGAVQSAMKENAQKYKELTPAEREHYNHVANEAKASNDTAYKRWVESHSADDVRKANIARRRLKLLLTKAGKLPKSSNAFSPIRDERQVKRPRTSYSLFFSERQKSGDFKQISMIDSAKLAGSEWKALSQAEKKSYSDLYEEDRARYEREFKSTYGFDAPSTPSKATVAATA